MTKLLLDSLMIQGFRAFDSLTIEKLGRVNLIVGKNNVGKSSLLEALSLYANKGSIKVIWDILEARDEFRENPANTTNDIQERSQAINSLFYGRKDIRGGDNVILIGPGQNKERTLSVTVGWYINSLDQEGGDHWQSVLADEASNTDNAFLRIANQFGTRPPLSYPLYENRIPVGAAWFRRLERSEFKEIPNIYRPSLGFKVTEVSSYWEKTTLTPTEQYVLAALRIIAPTIEGVNIVGDPQRRFERYPIVRLNGNSAPVPLRSLGEGMFRMFEIALAMANAKDGFLLLDEVENGIHYSVQPLMWTLIFNTARELNIQVFATSHSWDCIEAFQQAAVADQREEGMLIRLEQKQKTIVATLFDERELTIATRNDIEVR